MTSIINATLYRSLEEGTLLVTANRRLARSFVTNFHEMKQAQGLLAWATPNVLPLDAWWQSLYADLTATGVLSSHLLSEQQEHALWCKSLEASGEHAALLSVPATASALMKSWRVEHAYSGDADPWSHYLTDDQRAFQRWSTLYKGYCAQAGFVDMARLPVQLATALRSLAHDDNARTHLPRQLILAGFNQLTPQLKDFLTLCTELDVNVLPQYESDPVTGKAARCACADSQQELLGAALWAKKAVLPATASGASLPNEKKVAVVITDLHLRRAEVERVFDAVFFPAATPEQIRQIGRPYDVSLGQPLTRFAPVASALHMLELGFNRLDGAAISAFLLSPYLRHSESDKARRSGLDTRLRNNGYRTVRLHQLLEAELSRSLRSTLERMHKAASTASAAPSIWLARVIDMLDAAGWPGETAPQSLEYQAIEAWRDCIEEVVQLDGLVGNLTATGMLAMIRQITESRVFQPQTPDLPIQVLGTFESVGLQFDALWLTGFDNESWPPVQRPSSFLPLKWQKSVQAPGASADHEIAVSRALVKAFTQSASEVVFSYPQACNGNDVDLSVQIANLDPVELAECIGEFPDGAINRVFDSIVREELDDCQGPVVDQANPVRGGARLFEDQAKCPFRAFALHRLQIKPLEDAPLGIDARDKGNFFHDAMEIFWLDTVDQQQLLALSQAELSQRIEACVAEAIERNAPPRSQQDKSALLSIEQGRLERIVQQWIHYFEKTRAPFSVEKMEEDEEIEFESLKLRLKLDRVDQLTDGGRVIIDYKTGKNNSAGSWTDERITSAQLPLYAIIMKDIHAVCFAQVAVNKLQFIGMAREKGLLAGLKGPGSDAQSWDEQLAQWRQNLSVLAHEIRDGLATVTPVNSACQYCELPAWCRIDNNE